MLGIKNRARGYSILQWSGKVSLKRPEKMIFKERLESNEQMSDVVSRGRASQAEGKTHCKGFEGGVLGMCQEQHGGQYVYSRTGKGENRT